VAWDAATFVTTAFRGVARCRPGASTHGCRDWFNGSQLAGDTANRDKCGHYFARYVHFTGGWFPLSRVRPFQRVVRACPILKTPLNRILAKGRAAAGNCRPVEADAFSLLPTASGWRNLADRSAIVRACGYSRVIPPGIDTEVFRPQDKAHCVRSLGIQLMRS